MSVTKTVAKISGLALAWGLMLTGCSGQQQEDTGDIITNTNDSGSDDAGEPSGSGSGDNNASGNDAQGEDGGDDEAPATDPAPNDASAAVAPPATDPAPVENATPPPASNPAPAEPAASSAQAPIEGGRVRYVREGGAKVTSQASGGDIVRTLEQGEHPVTWDEGGAYRVGPGMYVSKDSMSDIGIPRQGFFKQ